MRHISLGRIVSHFIFDQVEFFQGIAKWHIYTQVMFVCNKKKISMGSPAGRGIITIDRKTKNLVELM